MYKTPPYQQGALDMLKLIAKNEGWEEKKEREEAEEISLIIRRLKEQGKYRELENEARQKAPVGSLQFTIDFIARSIVGQDPKKYRKLLNYDNSILL